MKCGLCKTEFPNDKLKCPNCGNWVLSDNSPTISNGNNGLTIPLSKVTSREDQRIDIGPWNRLWGGKVDKKGNVKPGLTIGGLSIIGGAPGAGKSTMFIQILDIVCKGDKKGLYIATEEALDDIRARADRLEAKNQDNFEMADAREGGMDIGTILSSVKPAIVVLDSLYGLVAEDDELANQVCKVCKDYAILLKCPIIISHHVTKGNEIAGLNTLQHAVDTVITVFPDDQEPDIRMFEVNPKNRHGQAFIREYFIMTEKGLMWTEPPDEDSEDD